MEGTSINNVEIIFAIFGIIVHHTTTIWGAIFIEIDIICGLEPPISLTQVSLKI